MTMTTTIPLDNTGVPERIYICGCGSKLIDIIRQFGNKSYDFVEFRCKYKDSNGKIWDDFFGACSYDGKTGKLTPLDGDCYSLDDIFNMWEESTDNDGNPVLTVWEDGVFSNA